ncbi:MAG: Spy/CpxP family protein refolding chaperone, partial [Candidatus Entotheonellia bacterium]
GGGGGFGAMGPAMMGGGGGFGAMGPAMMGGGFGGFGTVGPTGGFGGGGGLGPLGGGPWGAWGPTPGATTPLETGVTGHLLQQSQNYRLSPDQMRQLQDIQNVAQTTAIGVAAAIQAGEQELNTLMRAVPVDLVRVEAKIKEIEGLRAQQRLTHANALAQAYSALTPEQGAQLNRNLTAGSLIPWAIGPSAGALVPQGPWGIGPGAFAPQGPWGGSPGPLLPRGGFGGGGGGCM